MNQSWIDLAQPVGLDCIVPWGVELAWRGFSGNEHLPRFNSLVPTTFRTKLARAASASDATVALTSPEEVPLAERNERWVQLCESLVQHDDLPLAARERLVWLLHRLCFHKLIGDLANRPLPEGDPNTLAALRVTNALAAGSLALSRGQNVFASLFRDLLPSLPEGSVAAATASYHLVLEHTKFRPSPEMAAEAVQVHHHLVECAVTRLSKFDADHLWSRFYRVRAFLPMLTGDLPCMVDDMDRAEALARGLAPANEAERLAAAEILWPVLESRVREAQVLGSPTLVEQRARTLIDAAPLDSRAWLHLGEALMAAERFGEAVPVYREAHRLGPQSSEIALFNLGQCHEMLDEAEPALDAYAELLQVDPFAISAAERIVSIAAERGSTYQHWAEALLCSLETMRSRQKAV